ncbi:MAG: glycosyltransferase [Bacteroidales bacterium]|nr:glycosyltransferase [Bacteroidales bacterium]
MFSLLKIAIEFILRQLQSLMGKKAFGIEKVLFHVSEPAGIFHRSKLHEIAVWGWCFEKSRGSLPIKILVKVNNQSYECIPHDRPDVALHFKPQYPNLPLNAGFKATLILPNGFYLLKIIAVFDFNQHIVIEDKLLWVSCAKNEVADPLLIKYPELKDANLTQAAQKIYIRLKSKPDLRQQPSKPPVNADSALPKLAFVSPMPPEKSGISYYSVTLIPFLSTYYKIDVIVETDVSESLDNLNCSIRNYDWFRKNADVYDRVIYHIGNSKFHSQMLLSLQHIPGVVVLHDFYLSHLIAYMDDRGLRENAISQALYESHGYRPFSNNELTNRKEDIIWNYPCNLEVVQNAAGIIVHSEYAVKLARQWYGVNAGKDWAVVPHLKIPEMPRDRAIAREKLSIGTGTFVVGSFGFVGEAKCNTRLLKCWLASSLANDNNCYLVFIGAYNPDDGYWQEFSNEIKQSGLADRIFVTGWADNETYANYLSAVDVAVQLRARSRGETSGALLDCFNFGLPAIFNANGSMEEIQESTGFKLQDNFSDKELIAALETLYRDENLRKSYSVAAFNYIRNYHNPLICVKQYASVIENFYDNNARNTVGLMREISRKKNSVTNIPERIALAASLADEFAANARPKQLFFDVSAICIEDLKTGIQRVVRAILNEFLSHPPDGYRVEPVYSMSGNNFRYARRFTMQFLKYEKPIFRDTPVEFRNGDLFFCLDLIISRNDPDYIRRMIKYGVKVIFGIHDLLPLRFPQFFPSGSDLIFEKWLQSITHGNGVVCVSGATASDFRQWVATSMTNLRPNFAIDWFHLGADICSPVSMFGLPDNSEVILRAISQKFSFLIVATIEPRKGHAQTFDAFEELWKNNVDVNLVLVGKPGWQVDYLIKKIETHPEINRRLFWLNGISDEYLEKIYRVSKCLIAPSEGEGFGLPLIEAAQNKLPIIARDLAVFSEIAGNNAWYFHGNSGHDLAASIVEWLSLYKKGLAPKSENIKYHTWAQSAQKLRKILEKKYAD